MSSLRPLEGKIALVTGASRGIGEAIVNHLAAKGAHIIINYTSDSSTPQAEELARTLAAAHDVLAVAVQGDVAGELSDAGSASAVGIVSRAAAFFDAHETAFQIDILVNNAGIARNALLPDITYADFEETNRVNVLGPLRVMQAALPHLPPAGSRTGRIINVSSVSSASGFVGQTVYGASKAAVEAMTRVWARELAEHATVNAINPGPVEGPMYSSNSRAFLLDIHGLIERTPLMRPRPGVDPEPVVKAALSDPALSGGGRPAYTSEIAGIVAMLCLPEAGWCTGQVVSANGGMLMQ